MNTSRAIVLLALTGLLPSRVFAQVGSLRVTFSAPTPASLGKFGDVPVSLHTGIPEIAVPIFTVKGKTLELPITLRYHAGGIRVEEIGGWVGMGWALQAGGTITRTVRGISDDHISGFYYTGHAIYNHWQNPDSVMPSILNKTIDPEPDQFFFNFGGRSGQFVMGPTSSSDSLKEIRTIPYQKMKIEPFFNATAVSKWVITTEDGTRYTFAARDETTDNGFSVPDGSDTGGENHTSTWHLTEIRGPGWDIIDLYYSPYTARHRLNSYVEKFASVTGSCVLADYMFVAEHVIVSQRLDSIKSAAHTVVFSAPTLRSDALSPQDSLQQEPRLDLITVRTPTGAVIRRFQFDYDPSSNRLRLKHVYEQDPSGASLPPFTFTYDGQAFPIITSNAQDHWGFFNAKTNSTLVPGATGPGGAFLPGADRSPDSTKMKVGSLTRITFPTGGYNEFIWEANDYGGIGPDTVQPYDWGPNEFVNVTSNQYQGLNQTNFTVDGSVAVPVAFDFFIMPTCGDPTGCDDSPYVAVRRVTDVTDIESWHSSGRDTILLAPGSYTLRSYSNQEDGNAIISANWGERIAVNKKLAGGLRVAQIRTADGLGNVQVRKYVYTLTGNPAKSSGLINAEPAYAYTYNSPQCSYFSRSSQSKTPLGSGAVVSYREVTVLHGTTGEYGKSHETFRSLMHAPDGGRLNDAWPFSRTTSSEWKRGQRLDAAEYSSAGKTQRLLRSTYSFQDNDSITARSFRGLSVQPFSAGQYGQTVVYNPFEVISAWTYQSTDSTFTYDENGTSSFVTARRYDYDNPNHIQLTRLTETNSDGTRRITRMKYPADYASGSGNPEAVALSAMSGSAHMHSQVIERSVTELTGGTEKVVKAELTTFRSFGGRYLPYRRYVLNRAQQ